MYDFSKPLSGQDPATQAAIYALTTGSPQTVQNERCPAGGQRSTQNVYESPALGVRLTVDLDYLNPVSSPEWGALDNITHTVTRL